jgi:pimeloyl-ACP methyl ester carboxylesterase
MAVSILEFNSGIFAIEMFTSFIYHPQKYTQTWLEIFSAWPVQFAEFSCGSWSYTVPYVCIGPESETTVVFCHGNSGSIINDLSFLGNFSKRTGTRVISFDYPGYGFANGQPSDYANVRALNAVIGDLKRVVLMGYSLGTGVVMSYMAEYRPTCVESVHLIAPFTSIIDTVTDSFIVDSFFSLLSRDTYDNFENVNYVDCPVSVYVSKFDEVIPHTHGYALYRRLQQRGVPCSLYVHDDENETHGSIPIAFLDMIDV